MTVQREEERTRGRRAPPIIGRVAAPLFSRGSRVFRRLPAARLLTAAELVVLARQHVSRLEPHERRKVLDLLRAARGRPSRLTPRQRAELAALVAKAEPRMFLSGAVEKLTGVPLPGRGGDGRWSRRKS